MSLNVTDVRIKKVEGRGKLKALVSITFEDSFVVNEVKVINGKNGLFVAMPSTKDKKGAFRDIAHPIKSETREDITKTVLEAYEKVKDEEPETVEAEKEAEVVEEKEEKSSEE